MKNQKNLKKILLLFIGGIAITLSGINWTIGIAAWIAPVFLLHFTRNAKWKEMWIFFLVLIFSGMISQTSNNLFHLPTVNIFNGLIFGILTGISYVADKFLYKKSSPFYTSLVFPSVVVLVEFVVSFAIGTWGSMANTQFGFKPLLQFASIAGIFGISFLVAWFSSVVNWLIEKRNERHAFPKGVLIYGSILIAVLLFGIIRINLNSNDKETVKVATVLSETDIHQVVEKEEKPLKILASEYSTEIPSHIYSDPASVNQLISRTQKASEQGAKIVVWNEIALILNQDLRNDLLRDIKSLCSENNIYVLTAFLEETSELDKKPFNNKSVMVSPDGKVVWEYLKSYLHPYAETPIINKGNFEIPFIKTEFGIVGNVICADLDMPGYIRQAGKENVDILLVPAFDWPEITSLHSEMGCLEAIQFGFSLVRANGKGLAAMYDYTGNILASTNTLVSNEKILYAEVPVHSRKTFYSRTGNILILLSFGFLIFMTTKQLINRKSIT